MSFLRPCSLYLLGWFPQDVPNASSTPQAVTQHCDNAHEQGITYSLLVLDNHSWWLDDKGTYEDIYEASQLLYRLDAKTCLINCISQWQCFKISSGETATLKKIEECIWLLRMYCWFIGSAPSGLWGHKGIHQPSPQKRVTRPPWLGSLVVKDNDAETWSDLSTQGPQYQVLALAVWDTQAVLNPIIPPSFPKASS